MRTLLGLLVSVVVMMVEESSSFSERRSDCSNPRSHNSSLSLQPSLYRNRNMYLKPKARSATQAVD